MRRRRWLLWLAIACLTPVVLLLAVLLTAPLWLNEQFVKREVVQLISKATGGTAQFERIGLRFLPFPGVTVSGLKFSLSGQVEVQAQSAAVEIRLLPLLTGKVYPHSVLIVAPQVRIQLEEPKPSPPAQPKPPAPPFSLKNTEASVRAVLQQIEQTAPGVAAEIKTGALQLQIGQRPAVVVEKLDAHLDVTAGTVSAKVSCVSNQFERLSVDARVRSRDLDGDGQLELIGAQVAQLGAILGIQDGWPVREAVVSVKVKLRLHGLGDAHAQAEIGAPRVALQFGKGHLDLAGPVIELTARTKGASAEVMLSRLAVDSPRIAATARATASEADGFALEAEASDLDLPSVQAAADGLAPEVDFLQNFPVRFARGTVRTVKFSTQSAALANLFDLKALHINGTVEEVDLSLPVLYDLKVYEASALGSLEQGIVRAQNVRGRLEKSTAHDGTFAMDLTPDVEPLSAELTVEANLPEALAVAKRILPDRSAQRALAQIKQLEGTAVVHAAIGGNVNNVLPHVEATTLKASARHDLVPFPIRVMGGTITYTNEAVSVRALDGAVGQSNFSGVDARVSLSAPTVLTAQHGSVLLALEELFRWAAAQPKLAKQLEGVKAVTGGLAVTVSHADVPLSTPDLLRFQVNATPKSIAIDAPRYGPPLTLDGGVIEVSEQSVNADAVNVSALDAALKLSAHTDGYRQGVASVQGSLGGTVGTKAQRWIYRRAKLPRELALRGPLVVSQASVDWRKDAGVAAQGSVNVVGGPQLGFSVRSTPQRLEVEKFTVRDDASNVTFGGSLDDGHFTATYKGRLAGSSIARTFAKPLAGVGELKGDFQANGDLRRPDATTATGYLQGTKIALPPVLPIPVTIENLSLEAKNTVLVIKSATVSSGESSVDVNGTVAYLKDKFAIDADIKGKKVVVPDEAPHSEATAKPESNAAAKAEVPPAERPESDETSVSEAEPGEEAAPSSESIFHNEARQRALLEPLWTIPVAGIVRVDLGLLDARGLEIAPLVGSAALQTGRLELGLKRAALCGITLSGGVTATPDSADAELKLSARGIQLEKSIACLTEQRLQITGKLDMDGQFAARGKLGSLLDQLRGTFSATAKDGHINKFDSLAAVLKVVNVTQAFFGQMPDLSKGGMDYSSARVQGRVEGSKIFFHEVALDASALTVAAHGNIDY
ncbi:MAG TPA: AsmA-like C-terminal region-containing protein, partial [Burkholderiales bacterium]|nr:AsmA-like C-terminal region-containing protein [Burkholderiales bacterium]